MRTCYASALVFVIEMSPLRSQDIAMRTEHIPSFRANPELAEGEVEESPDCCNKRSCIRYGQHDVAMRTEHILPVIPSEP